MRYDLRRGKSSLSVSKPFSERLYVFDVLLILFMRMYCSSSAAVFGVVLSLFVLFFFFLFSLFCT